MVARLQSDPTVYSALVQVVGGKDMEEAMLML